MTFEHLCDNECKGRMPYVANKWQCIFLTATYLCYYASEMVRGPISIVCLILVLVDHSKGLEEPP